MIGAVLRVVSGGRWAWGLAGLSALALAATFLYLRAERAETRAEASELRAGAATTALETSNAQVGALNDARARDRAAVVALNTQLATADAENDERQGQIQALGAQLAEHARSDPVGTRAIVDRSFDQLLRELVAATGGRLGDRDGAAATADAEADPVPPD